MEDNLLVEFNCAVQRLMIGVDDRRIGTGKRPTSFLSLLRRWFAGRQSKAVALQAAEAAAPSLARFGRDQHLVGTAVFIMLAEHPNVPSITVGAVDSDDEEFLELRIHIPARKRGRPAKDAYLQIFCEEPSRVYYVHRIIVEASRAFIALSQKHAATSRLFMGGRAHSPAPRSAGRQRQKAQSRWPAPASTTQAGQMRPAEEDRWGEPAPQSACGSGWESMWESTSGTQFEISLHDENSSAKTTRRNPLMWMSKSLDSYCSTSRKVSKVSSGMVHRSHASPWDQDLVGAKNKGVRLSQSNDLAHAHSEERRKDAQSALRSWQSQSCGQLHEAASPDRFQEAFRALGSVSSAPCLMQTTTCNQDPAVQMRQAEEDRQLAWLAETMPQSACRRSESVWDSNPGTQFSMHDENRGMRTSAGVPMATYPDGVAADVEAVEAVEAMAPLPQAITKSQWRGMEVASRSSMALFTVNSGEAWEGSMDSPPVNSPTLPVAIGIPAESCTRLESDSSIWSLPEQPVWPAFELQEPFKTFVID